MKYFWYLPKKKVNFLFLLRGKNLTVFPSHFLFILLGLVHLVGIILDVNIVYTENGL